MMTHFYKEWLRYRGSLPRGLGAKLCTQSGQNQDKTKAKEEWAKEGAAKGCVPAREQNIEALELLEADSLRRRGQTAEGKCRDPPSSEVPAQGCLNSTADSKGKGRFSGH